ncbi:hypothetical protein Hypma_011007 [Hypsizygus marmoreus]|uniref:Uncharacterized protein n=1 Tax=Hypsizygus marmoreus TaxID=39966 RepID=A0A369JIG7_HYPMA|nr:hypothetical protein Hypma_011007 [Hypsizygus marmoreus]
MTSDTRVATMYFGRELPLITRDSIPTSPRIANTRRNLGPLVNLRVLGFAFPMEAQEQWCVDHGIGLEEDDTYLDRVNMCWKHLPRALPPDCRRTATIDLGPNFGLASCIVVATNKTLEDLGRAEDIEMIRRVQAIIGATKPPAWYYPERIW